ncbi:MAG: phosphotransferase family protein [Gammaproteobacteria bacterium]
MNDSTGKYLGQTVDVKPAHRIDAARLDAWLAGNVPGYAGPLTIRQFEGGQSNPTYLLETPRRKYVMRRKPPGVLLKSAHAVDREFRVMKALGEHGFPVPQMLALCEDESVIGTMFYLMAHVPGRVFLDNALPDLAPDQRAAVYDSVNETLARLHSFDYAALGLGDFGRPGNYFERQIKRWSQQYEASRTDDIPEMERLIEWLPTAIPQTAERSCVIHGDYSLHNLLVDPQRPKVVAVIDWELSTIGHPFGDLMYHMMEWYRPPGIDPRGTLRGRDLKALGIPDFDAYVARYCERTGLSLDRAALGFHRAYNLFRVAAILQGVAGRLRDGTAASANAAEMGTRVRPLAQAAWNEAREVGAA